MASSGTQQGIIRFGPFELDPVNRELRKHGISVRLQPQQFAVLLMLAQRAGQIVSRDEIHQHIWGTDTFVDFERGINFAINQIRAALGDDAASPRFIETIPRRGYRFIAPIENGASSDSASATPIAQIENGKSAGPATSVTPISGDRTSTASRDQDQVNSLPDVNAALADAPARPPFAKAILIGLSVLAIIAAGLLSYRVLSARAKHTLPTSQFPNLRITQLTSLPGQYWDPAFSPDGRQIAFLWDGENPLKGDLYVQLAGSEKPLRLTHSSTGYVCCADWSPDGRQIIFGRCDDNGGGVFTIPTLGGSERKLTEVVCQFNYAGGAKWTADGRSLVLADRCTPDAPPGIVVFSQQTGEKRCLHSPPANEDGDVVPVLSPDQKTVAFLRGAWDVYEIDTVAFSGGNLRRLTNESVYWTDFTLMWSPDGKYIAFEFSRDRMARVPVSGGPIEFNSVYPRVGTLSRDGRRLAYVEPATTWRFAPVVWRAKLSNAGGKVISQSRVLVSATGGNSSAQLSPSEQQLVFHSMRSGTEQIWKSNADGSDPLQLTFFETGYPGIPRWSPDEKWIVFEYRNAAQRVQIYLIDSEGRNLRRLSDDYRDGFPSWSRDGKAIYFTSNRSGNWQVWRHEISTGKETQITQHGGVAAFESYDAKTIYYSKFDRGGLWKVPVGGGQEVLVTDSLHLGYWGHYAVTDNGLYLVDADAKGGPAIMYYNFHTRRLSLILTFEKNPVPWEPNLAASRDGRTLLYAQVEFENSTISMAENFQ
jgi:Tol biopolymer transport system component/DNA-binding winged helix-turn-helix (wHTH) protein